MRKLFAISILAVGVVVPWQAGAGIVTNLTVLPEPAISTMQLTPDAEIVRIEFTDGSAIESPEVDTKELQSVDFVEIYNLPFDFWIFRVEASSSVVKYGWRTRGSWGCSFEIDGRNFVLHVGADVIPYKVTDVGGNEIPVEEDYLAEMDRGSMDVLGYRTFTMIDYRDSPGGELLRRTLRPSTIGPIPAE